MMLALRGGERTVEEMAAASHVPIDEARLWSPVLVNLDYATLRAGRFSARIRVFVRTDREAIKRLRTVGRGILQSWLAANYGPLKAELADTTPTRWGVRYEEGFTMIWHFVFGLANRNMLEGGMFADPYARERRHKGFIPAVSEAGLQ